MDYATLKISSNGFVSFDASPPNGCCSGQNLPNASAPNNLIAMWWEDLDPPEGGSITYEAIGTSPNSIFLVNFTDIQHFPSGDPVTMQLQLREADDSIEIHYTDASSNPGLHTVGVENAGGTIAATWINAQSSPPAQLATALRITAANEADGDGDGVLSCDDDCDDTEASVYPGAPEVADDGIDQDCDGEDLVTPPVAPCDGGSDFVQSGDPWVVCRVGASDAWVSANDGGRYEASNICESLGYSRSVTSYGGTCGNVCGYCQGSTSCNANGNETYDSSGNQGGGPDNLILATTVHWRCVM